MRKQTQTELQAKIQELYKRGVPQAQIARELDCHTSYVSRYLLSIAGSRSPAARLQLIEDMLADVLTLLRKIDRRLPPERCEV